MGGMGGSAINHQCFGKRHTSVEAALVEEENGSIAHGGGRQTLERQSFEASKLEAPVRSWLIYAVCWAMHIILVGDRIAGHERHLKAGISVIRTE